MEKKKLQVLPDIIILALISICYLIFPTQENCVHDGWLTSLTGINSIGLLWIKNFLIEPLWWGIFCFSILRCANIWLENRGIQIQVKKKTRVIMGVVAIVFKIALVYWTGGYLFTLSPLPPMPFKLGFYIMNHRVVLGIGWCVAAVAWHFSLKNTRIFAKH